MTLTKKIKNFLQWLNDSLQIWQLSTIHSKTRENQSVTVGIMILWGGTINTCNNKAPGHKDEATKTNTMGGSMAKVSPAKSQGNPAGVNDGRTKLSNYLDLTSTHGCANAYMTNKTALIDSSAL